MGEKEQLNREHSRLIVKKQELFDLRKSLDPKVAKVNNGEETEPFSDIEERIAKIDKVDKELEEVKKEIMEVEEKIRNLKP